VWGTDPVYELATAYTGVWGVGVGEPSPTITTDVLPGLGSDAIYCIGGRMQLPGLLGATNPDLYGFAYEVDASLTAVRVGGYLQPIEMALLYPYP
jgi:hypothetical protein